MADLVLAIQNYNINDSFQFLNAVRMKKVISRSLDVWNSKYPGIVEVISTLATTRLAEMGFSGKDIETAACLIVYDLQDGMDGFERTEIPKFELLRYDNGLITVAIQSALFSCAMRMEKNKQEPAESKENQKKAKAEEVPAEACERGPKKAKT